jgi:hypothetical protein
MPPLEFNDVLTPELRAQQFRVTAATRKPGDSIELPAKPFDFGLQGPIFPGCVVTGADKLQTILRCAESWKNTDAAAFQLVDGLSLSNLTLESTCLPNEQSCLFGFGVGAPAPRRARLRNVVGNGRSWGGYFAHGRGDTIDLEDCLIRAANVGIAAFGSGGAGAQFVNLGKNMQIEIDPERATQGGSVTNPFDGGSIGLLVRGGVTNVLDLTVRAKGQAKGRGPMCCAVSDHLGDPIKFPSSKSLVINIFKLTSQLTPGEATLQDPQHFTDVSKMFGTINRGGFGRGPGGGLLETQMPIPTTAPAGV